MHDMVYLVRALRAHPPGAAADSTSRRRTFNAAIDQFETLLHSSRTVGASARPLLLFYALNQAGRALVAAYGERDEVEVRTHGLEEDRMEEPISRCRIRASGEPGLAGAVARITGSGVLKTSVQLGALWAALPDLTVPTAAADGSFRALQVWPRLYSRDPLEIKMGTAACQATVLPPPDVDPETLEQMLEHYPGARGARIAKPAGLWAVEGTPFGSGFRLVWDKDTDDAIDVYLRFPRYRFEQEHWLIPAVEPTGDVLYPFMLWWMLLFGLSLIARYRPAEWVAALDPDASELSVPLEALLADAQEAMPHLVLEELTKKEHLLLR